jgi:hypothetical protein
MMGGEEGAGARGGSGYRHGQEPPHVTFSTGKNELNGITCV